MWQEHFQMHELIEIMRQKNDLRFTEMLNRLRENKLHVTAEDKDIINLRNITSNCSEYPKHAPHFFIENIFVDTFNSNLLENLTT